MCRHPYAATASSGHPRLAGHSFAVIAPRPHRPARQRLDAAAKIVGVMAAWIARKIPCTGTAARIYMEDRRLTERKKPPEDGPDVYLDGYGPVEGWSAQRGSLAGARSSNSPT
jgi:hypothetical protein